jgi:hypothetical protein
MSLNPQDTDYLLCSPMAVTVALNLPALFRFWCPLMCRLCRNLTEISTIIDPVALGYFLVALGSIIVGISVSVMTAVVGHKVDIIWRHA